MTIDRNGSGAEIEQQVLRFGARLRGFRHQAGLSQLTLAQRAGVDLAAVSFLERAKRAPNLGTLVRVARAVGVSPATLIMDSDTLAPVDRASEAAEAGAAAGRGADPLLRFGANLRNARKDAGMSQEMLSQQARLDRAAISIIERGGRSANLRTILKLARALGLAPEALLEGVQ
ncbi:MAG: helix-turn-helix domain-containing protein [Acidobacteriota bacterium]|nr:helix-turn-helix domain-containing protein [Acidobacteriota bacterium]